MSKMKVSGNIKERTGRLYLQMLPIGINTITPVSILLRDLDDILGQLQVPDRRCMAYNNGYHTLLLLVSVNVRVEMGIIQRLGLKYTIVHIRDLELRDMILVDTIPKVDHRTPIRKFLRVDDPYEDPDADWMEDLHCLEVIRLVEDTHDTTHLKVVHGNTIDDPVIRYAGEFIHACPHTESLYILMGMVNYHASLVGEDMYDGIEPTPCTRLEMESLMMGISRESYNVYISNVSMERCALLVESHRQSPMTQSEAGIVAILYDGYVAKYVSVGIQGREMALWGCLNGVWREVSIADIWRDLVGIIAIYMDKQGLTDVRKYLGSVSARERIIKDLMYRICDDRLLSKLNSNSHLIGMANGVYDTDMGILRDPLPADYISMSTGRRLVLEVDYWKHKTKALMNILCRIFPEKDLLRYFIATCAGMLEGSNKNKLVYVWWGKGNNGKSMIEKLVSKALGDYATVAATSLITGKRPSADNATPQLSALEGKLVVFLQEPNPNEVIRIGIVKELSGGDTITTRALFRSPRTFTPKFKLVLVCNNVMEIPNADIAFRNRLVVIPFVSTFVTREDYNGMKKGKHTYIMDTGIARNIAEYADVFLCMLVKEYQRIKGMETVEVPEVVRRATKDYMDYNNSCLSFINACVTTDDVSETPVDIMYAEYRHWVREMGLGFMDINRFRDELSYRGYTMERGQDGKLVVCGTRIEIGL
ncbi:phage/plasmid primase [Linnemannia elongata AG-77]|uniref:Phage/plasmid primase n=1 Tax=Linnemannia elongata AG-77 TaxID=1314771 RepID=A0A197JVY3_9FUNG|nr:phage/plasmid primase [Linnemannia elongata AG-77]